MPYGNDDWLEESAEKARVARIQGDIEREKELRESLKQKFQVPDEFMELALRIWTDGKYD